MREVVKIYLFSEKNDKSYIKLESICGQLLRGKEFDMPIHYPSSNMNKVHIFTNIFYSRSKSVFI